MSVTIHGWCRACRRTGACEHLNPLPPARSVFGYWSARDYLNEGDRCVREFAAGRWPRMPYARIAISWYADAFRALRGTR